MRSVANGRRAHGGLELDTREDAAGFPAVAVHALVGHAGSVCPTKRELGDSQAGTLVAAAGVEIQNGLKRDQNGY